MTTGKETPTEFLIRSLENIEDADDVVLIVRKKVENGIDEIEWFANDVPLWKLLGMLEYAKHDMCEAAEENEGE